MLAELQGSTQLSPGNIKDQSWLGTDSLRFGGPDLLSVYVHLEAKSSIPGTSDVHWRWPNGNLEAWRTAISELPSCQRQRGVARFPSVRRLGGVWLSTKKMPCSGGGRLGARGIPWVSQGYQEGGWSICYGMESLSLGLGCHHLWTNLWGAVRPLPTMG